MKSSCYNGIRSNQEKHKQSLVTVIYVSIFVNLYVFILYLSCINIKIYIIIKFN